MSISAFVGHMIMATFNTIASFIVLLFIYSLATSFKVKFVNAQFSQQQSVSYPGYGYQGCNTDSMCLFGQKCASQYSSPTSYTALNDPNSPIVGRCICLTNTQCGNFFGLNPECTSVDGQCRCYDAIQCPLDTFCMGEFNPFAVTPKGGCTCQPSFKDTCSNQGDCIFQPIVSGISYVQIVNFPTQPQTSGSGYNANCSCWDPTHVSGNRCQIDSLRTTICSNHGNPICPLNLQSPPISSNNGSSIIIGSQCTNVNDFTAYRGTISCQCDIAYGPDLVTNGVACNIFQPCNPPCPSGSTCGVVDGFEQCICSDPTLRVDLTNTVCIPYHCGAYKNDPTACSGNGICISKPGNLFEYCSCNTGFDGDLCQIETPTYDLCDCGIRWTENAGLSHTEVQLSYPGLTILTDNYNNPNYQNTVQLLQPLQIRQPNTGIPHIPYFPTVFLPVNSRDQAKKPCHNDVYCQLLLFYTDNGISRAIFAYIDPANANPVTYILPISIPNTVNFDVFTIDRNSFNICPSFSLDVNFYYRQYQGAILSYVNNIIDTNLPILLLTTPKLTGGCSTEPNGFCSSDYRYWINRHWRYIGHAARLSPNSGCSLDPVFLNQTYCQYAKCPSIYTNTAYNSFNAPCMGVNSIKNGYCLPAPQGSAGYILPSKTIHDYNLQFTTTGYQCKCFSLAQVYGISVADLQYKDNAFWQGIACDQSVLTCVNPSGSVFICNNFISSCQPRRLWNGEFYLGPTVSLEITDTSYIPECNCNGTNYEGTYCEISRCGVNSNGCSITHTASGDILGLGNCDPVGNGLYQCVCGVNVLGQAAIGQYCEIDGSACVGSNGFKCQGVGTCNPPNLSINKTQAYCTCLAGYSGLQCQITACSSDIMIPGHGVCADGFLQNCYIPYTGIKCEYDNCANTGGAISFAQFPPATCICGPGLQLLYSNTGTPSCWPMCPSLEGIANSTCGTIDLVYSQGTRHLCSLVQDSNGIRSATCECATNYIQVNDPNTGNLICQKYCYNGLPGPGWSPGITTINCVCARSTGFFVNSGNNPRCDFPICYNSGVFDSLTSVCACLPPYLSSTDCFINSCGNNGAVVSYIDVFTGIPKTATPFKCQCNIPYKPANPLLPFDCNSNTCSTHGLVNTNFNSQTQLAISACLCLGKYKTSCITNPFTSVTICSYCASSFCKNGGSVSSNNVNVCACPFPYINGAQNICELNTCNSTGTNIIDSFNQICICKPQFAGLSCSDPFCKFGGVFNNTLQACNCPILAKSMFILSPNCTVLGNITYPVSSSSSSSTGIAISSTPSSSVLTTQQIQIIAITGSAAVVVSVASFSIYWWVFRIPKYLPIGTMT